MPETVPAAEELALEQAPTAGEPQQTAVEPPEAVALPRRGRCESKLEEGRRYYCLLTSSLARSRTTQLRESVGGEYLPLSVWVSKGFSEEAVLASKSKEHKTLGMTYNLEIESVTIDTLEAECHTQLLERESAVQQRKNKGKKGSKRAAPAAEGEEEEEEEEDLRLPAASGSPATTAESGSAAKRAKLERAAAAQKRKADQAEAKQAALKQGTSRRLLAAATKGSASASKVVERLEKAVEAAKKFPGHEDLLTYQSAASCLGKLRLFCAQAAAVVRKASLSWSRTSTWT